MNPFETYLVGDRLCHLGIVICMREDGMRAGDVGGLGCLGWGYWELGGQWLVGLVWMDRELFSDFTKLLLPTMISRISNRRSHVGETF